MKNDRSEYQRQFCLLQILGILVVVAIASSAGAKPKPNIVLILADDLGYGDLGCYGNKVNRTPHLDRLARGGMRFTDFHSNAANCSPTRAALLTGRYQQRMGIEGALGENAPGLRQDEVTVGERLKEAGYATALMGKWHLGYHPENGPIHHGFDTFVGHLHGATDYSSHVDKYGRMDWWHQDRAVEEPGYNTTLITEHSVRFIEEHREDPFLLFVSHSAIHFPWQTPDDPPCRKAGKRYEGSVGKLGLHAEGPVQPVVQRMIEELDTSTGRIVETLERLQIAENTLVFFTSDNGGIVKMAEIPITEENRISDNSPLRGQKHGLYEGGHRVPAMAWWPGTIRAGTESPAIAMTMDLFSTFLELAGLELPGGHSLDGTSLLPVLMEEGSLPDRSLFWRQGNSRGVRAGPWKIVSIHDTPFELFDLSSDIGERKNLASERPDKLSELRRSLEDWESAFR